MIVTYSGGTTQQRQWVQDAITQCSYPLTDLAVNLTVAWTDALPVSGDIGHLHSYMVTQGSGGTYTISIATWADDANHPENAGLPNPAADIYEFYKQSFVHELGHVVHLARIITDVQRQAAAAQFWTTQITGSRQYGTLPYWAAPVWAENMMEAIAEAFKLSFFKGRLIYGDRTIWKIDEAPFGVLMGMLMPSAGGADWRDDFSVDDLAAYTAAVSFTVGGGTLNLPAQGAGAATTGILLEGQVLVAAPYTSVKVVQIASEGVSSAVLALVAGSSAIDGLFAYDEFTLTSSVDAATGLAGIAVASALGVSTLIIPVPAPPFWIVLDGRDFAAVRFQLWGTDPAAGGTPLYAVAVAADPFSGPYEGELGSLVGGASNLDGTFFNNDIPTLVAQTLGIRLDDYVVGAGQPVAPPPYPQLTPGTISPGAQQLGVLRGRLDMSRVVQAKRIA